LATGQLTPNGKDAILTARSFAICEGTVRLARDPDAVGHTLAWQDQDMKDTGDSRLSLWQVARRLWRFMGHHRKLYVFGMFLGILDAACQTFLPMVFRTVLNSLQDSPETFMAERFWPMLAAVAALIALFLPVAFFFHVLVSISMARLTREMRVRLYSHVQWLSADFFQRRKVGDVTQRLNNDIDTLSSAGMTMMAPVWGGFVIVWAMAMMIYIDYRLTLLFVVMMTGVTAWARVYLPRIRRMSRQVRDALGDVSATVTEYVGINELVKSFTSESVVSDKVTGYTDRVRRKQEHLALRQFFYGDVTQVLVRFVGPLILLFVGAWMISGGRMRVGDLVAFWGFWVIVSGTVQMLVSSFAHLFAGLASADRVFELFDETPTVQDAPHAVDLNSVRGEINFEAVTFNYPTESDQAVLDEISFSVRAGTRVAIVGPSGAGKSTILQLILRFYDPLGGRVTIDGQDLRGLTQQSIRANTGIVMQESIFFSGTIEENLRFGRADATIDQMRQALDSADMLAFIDSQPSGIQTVLGERGARLSGGQKQRLSIARVFLKDPPIVLFDEATSSLDSLAERQVQQAMARLMKGRTTIVVAHRISTIQSAHSILVVSDGKLCAQGKHEELIGSNPLYRDLYRHQRL